MFESFKLRSLLREHDDRLTTVERQLKSMQLEWTDTLDRLRSTMLRIRKERERVEAALPADEGTTEDEVDAGLNGSTLSSRALEINRQILARRNRLKEQ